MSTPLEHNASMDLGHYARVLRRRWYVVLAAAVVGVLLALAFLASVPRTVTATTSVDVNVISSDPFNLARPPADLLDAETEAESVTSSEVLESAASEIGGVSPSEIRSNVEAGLLTDATVMRITYAADSTDDAEAGVDAIAEAYLDYRSARAAERVERIVEQLNVRRDALRQDLVRINTIIAGSAPSSRRAVQAETDRQLINIELDSLSTQINSFLGLDTTGGTVLSTAGQNPTLVAPSRALVLGVGLLAGLVVGVVLAFLLGALDRRVRDDHDLRRLGAGETLGELTGQRSAVPAEKGDMDTLRAVRELLLATLPGVPPTVAVTDLTTTGHVPDVATNLAVAFAETGRPVDLVLADADERSVEAAVAALGLSPVTGAGSDDVPRYRRAGDRFTLVVPRAGILPAPPARVVAETDGSGESTVTVVAVPRTAPDSVVLSAGRMGHAVVLVVSRGGTRRARLTKVVQELSVVGATVHGTLVTPRRRRTFRARNA